MPRRRGEAKSLRPTTQSARRARPRAKARNITMKRHGRRPRFNTPLTEARDLLVRAVMRPLRWFRPTTRFIICFLALASVSTLLLARTRSALTSAEVYQEGDVVRADVIAPADISSTDARATEARREAARRETLPVWNYDPTQIESSVQSFRA